MDTQQTNLLNQKMDGLHRMVEQLSSHVAQALESPHANGQAMALGTGSGRYSYQAYRAADSFMEHKDVLSDYNNFDSMTQGGDKSFSSEIQIQRLTAQLTAAYNRIAALEEQLLSQRKHLQNV